MNLNTILYLMILIDVILLYLSNRILKHDNIRSFCNIAKEKIMLSRTNSIDNIKKELDVDFNLKMNELSRTIRSKAWAIILTPFLLFVLVFFSNATLKIFHTNLSILAISVFVITFFYFSYYYHSIKLDQITE